MGKREPEGWGIRASEEKERKSLEGKGKRESEGRRMRALEEKERKHYKERERGIRRMGIRA